MQAIILAAGMGKRLKNLTSNNTKCMVNVNGKTMIERMLNQIDKRSLSKIVIVVGYEGEKLKEYIDTLDVATPIVYVDNPIYNKTNNIYSLSLASEWLIKEDTLLFESDLIFEDSVLDELINDDRKTLALVDKYECWMDGTVVKLDDEDNITDFVPGKKFLFKDITSYYKTVNIYKFSKEFSVNKYVPFLHAYQQALGVNEYYEQVLKIITLIDKPEIKAKRLNGQKWYEIDDIQDLDIAESIFNDSKYERYEAISKRFGGYWRYPKVVDFCYLVNPYYPPQRLLDEVKANMENLITQYPSGMQVISLLAAKNYAVNQENIVVGNGAAELIKCIIEESAGKIGFIRPSFEEYYNRSEEKKSVVFTPFNDDFSYSADDLINFYENKNISLLVLVNPDNPTGNYIPKIDVLRIAQWCDNRGIQLIYDESFIDFADEENSSIISTGEFENFSKLVVIKSISKSYGIPGLRLGICVSSDCEIIASLKKSVSIWNINSLAEFYLQIEGKYTSSYKEGLKKIKKVRKKYIESLNQIKEIKVFPSEANYIMVELLDGYSASDVCSKLLSDNNLLVKNLSKKYACMGRQLLRLAVRTEEDNDILIKALRNYFKEN